MRIPGDSLFAYAEDPDEYGDGSGNAAANAGFSVNEAGRIWDYWKDR